MWMKIIKWRDWKKNIHIYFFRVKKKSVRDIAMYWYHCLVNKLRVYHILVLQWIDEIIWVNTKEEKKGLNSYNNSCFRYRQSSLQHVGSRGCQSDQQNLRSASGTIAQKRGLSRGGTLRKIGLMKRLDLGQRNLTMDD